MLKIVELVIVEFSMLKLSVAELSLAADFVTFKGRKLCEASDVIGLFVLGEASLELLVSGFFFLNSEIFIFFCSITTVASFLNVVGFDVSAV